MVEFAQATGLSGRGEVATVIHGGDENLYVEFYKNPTDGLDHVKMMIPGDKTFMPDYIADERYQRRFARQWEAYKTQKDQFEGETRLEELAWIDPATRTHYNSLGVFTLEGLSSVADGMLSNLGPEARKFRERAMAEIDQHRKAAAYEKTEAEKAEMQGQIDELKSLVESLQPKRRGRPPKEVPDAAA